MAERLPEPPANLRDHAPRADEIFVLPAGTPVWRIYRTDHPHANWSLFRHVPPDTHRFDHNLGTSAASGRRSILYAAESAMTCIAEVFQEPKHIDPFRGAPRLAQFAFRTDLRLLDLAGTWITRAGGSMAIGAGPHGAARRWSRAIYDAFPDIVGLRYASSTHANRPCFALYDRAEAGIDANPLFDESLAHPNSNPSWSTPPTHWATTWGQVRRTLATDPSVPAPCRPARPAPRRQRETPPSGCFASTVTPSTRAKPPFSRLHRPRDAPIRASVVASRAV